MCTGKCSKVIAIPLYILAGVSIICNIIAFFPDWSTKYAQEDRDGNGDRITEEIKYMGGFIGGGLMCLIPAIHIHLTSSNGCCANRCGMFLSIGFAAAEVPPAHRLRPVIGGCSSFQVRCNRAKETGLCRFLQTI
ncbi:Transmembrane 4 L6 family member 5 [Salmo salar]|uniref:Transmembrane 4 L6 family member 5 n=1 Tax=Salmo salar TaxID=8030 RepID=B5XG93_SALSA|nr:Transmembrane 4 L6 family member 5 [Salmo salar]ACI69863.1 Transmembrane 4 L6 family member 5 [Salmo salar]|eukprot:NP_001135010.1 Transmembrane 4 L6 family member 5 [Salmo salar]